MQCKKCHEVGTIILRKKDSYCTSCFLINTNHKFRASLGKNKTLSKNQKVLICLSGGVGSTVLLDLVNYGLNQDNHKKLRICPYFLHICENCDQPSVNNLIEGCRNYGFNLFVSPIAHYMDEENIVLPEPNSICIPDQKLLDKYQSLINSLSDTAKSDLTQKIKRKLFITFAKLLECEIIFTAETTSTLAVNLLSNLALGRGNQIEHDIGFCDLRDDKIKIIRPMKDISAEELDHYANINKLNPLTHHSSNTNHSLQAAIKTFVTDLQDNFQATISTVCKTADKIGTHDIEGIIKKCKICESVLYYNNSKLTSLEATSYSRMVSLGCTDITHPDDGNVKSIFPLINTHLCYGCSKNYSEIEKSHEIKSNNT